jgi:hypothetical protein
MARLLSSQKFPSSGGGSMLVSTLTPRLSFQANAVKFPLILTLVSPFVNLSFFGLKSEGTSFLLGLTVLHECIFHFYKSSKSLGDEKKLSINSLCPKPSTLQVKCLTVACVVVISSVAECESVPKYTFMSYVYPDSSQSS